MSPLNYWIPNRGKMLQDIEAEKRKVLELYAQMQAPLWGALGTAWQAAQPALYGAGEPFRQWGMLGTRGLGFIGTTPEQRAEFREAVPGPFERIPPEQQRQFAVPSLEELKKAPSQIAGWLGEQLPGAPGTIREEYEALPLHTQLLAELPAYIGAAQAIGAIPVKGVPISAWEARGTQAILKKLHLARLAPTEPALNAQVSKLKNQMRAMRKTGADPKSKAFLATKKNWIKQRLRFDEAAHRAFEQRTVGKASLEAMRAEVDRMGVQLSQLERIPSLLTAMPKGAISPPAVIRQVPRMPSLLDNPLPHTMPATVRQGLTPYKVKNLINLTGMELATHLKAPPLEMKPITKATFEKPLKQRILDRIGGFSTRTYRTERLLLRADGYEEGGKMQQAFWQSVDKATNAKLTSYFGRLGVFRNLLKNNNIDLGRMLATKIETAGITLTSSERIGIALSLKNADNILHVVFGNNIPIKTMEEVVASLSPQEKAITNFLHRQFQEQGQPLSNAVKEATGKPMDVVGDYFPIRIERRALAELEFNRLLIDEAKMRYGVRYASAKVRKGFTLPRKHRGLQPVRLDAIGLWLENLDAVEHYKAFMSVTRDLQTLLNNPALKRAIITTQNAPDISGQAVWSVLDQWLKDVSATNAFRVTSTAEAVLRRLRVNAVTAVLGFNITTALKQFPSFVSGAAEAGAMDTMKGLFTYLNQPKETGELLKRYAPQIYHRMFEREIAEARMMAGIGRRITGKLSPREAFMFLTTTMDKLAVRGIWRGAFDKGVKQGMSPEEAAEVASKVIRKTQPYFTVKDIPEFWRSGEGMKMLTVFTNQLNQYWNYYRFDILGKWRAGKISSLDVVRKVFFAFVLPAIMIGAVSRSRPAKDAKEFAQDLGGLGLATIPIAGNFLSRGIRGMYDSGGVITTELLDRFQAATYRASRGQWVKLAQMIPELAGFMAGVPVAQPKRTIQGIIRLAQGKSDDLLELIWSEYARRQAQEPKEEPARRKPLPFKSKAFD